MVSSVTNMLRLVDLNLAKVDPHHYTHGRWLHQNNVQQSSRYLRFNFQALCERILRLIPEASIITDCEKKEGGFNRIFIFTLDNDIKIVARLPTHVAGPPNLTTESEVATMSYSKRKLVSLSMYQVSKSAFFSKGLHVDFCATNP